MKDIGEFLSTSTSVGPLESNTGHTEFTSHEAADLDVKFLQALIVQNHSLSASICKISYFLCASGNKYSFTQSKCSPATPWKMFNGAILYDIKTDTPKMVMPPNLKSLLNTCKRRGERFMVLGFGLYPTRDLEIGHSNALLFDVESNVVERYEPSDIPNRKLDALIRDMIASLLGSSWNYISHQGGQDDSDSFNGMCVTFSLMYILLRLLNAERTPRNVHRYLRRRNGEGTLRKDVLQLNRFVVDTLRRHRRGTLIKRGGHSGSLDRRIQRDREQTHAMVRRGTNNVSMDRWLRMGRLVTLSMIT